MDEKTLTKIQKALDSYYETDEINIDLANKIHNYCGELFSEYKRLLKETK